MDAAQGRAVTVLRLAKPQLARGSAPGCSVSFHPRGGSVWFLVNEKDPGRRVRPSLSGCRAPRPENDHGKADISRIHPAASELTAVSAACCEDAPGGPAG